MFEWDEEKDRENQAKRGLPLAEAAALFRGNVVTIRDDRFDYGEERFVAYGEIAGRLHVCVYTDRGDTRRIISFRKANQRETDAYGTTRND